MSRKPIQQFLMELQRKIGVLAILASLPRLPGAGAAAPHPVSFDRDIRPILSENCFFCHGPDAGKRKAHLRLDDPNDAKRDRGKSIVIRPGDPAGSELMRRITHPDPSDRMPPPESKKQLTSPQIERLRRWIQEGAPYERHWSYVPPVRPELPAVQRRSWLRNPIDSFILHRLEQDGLSPGDPADGVTLIRRLNLDLLGFPPAPDEVDPFLAGDRPDALERQVDRLLASPHFGERMAVYWLDLVRFADTVGYHGDQDHDIGPYRDYVIKSFNEDLPFDRFTIEQLAGDLLPNPTLWQRVATGYNRVLQTTHEGGAQDKEYLAKYAADRVRNLSTVWLGATLGCAQCHDHKYDPFTQRDFYSMAAFFGDLTEQGAYAGPNSIPTRRPPEIPAWNLQQYGAISTIEKALKHYRRLLADPDSRSDALQDRIRALEQRKSAITKHFAMTMVSVARAPRVMRILPRGNWMDESGEIVQPAVPRFLSPIQKDARANRLDLARWLTDRRNPLAARVMVNRLWYLFFGSGLSKQLDDLGSQGAVPLHAQLLDWLAVEFMESGWDLKHMVRLLVTSATYRQSSRERPVLRQRDPENRLLGRQSRFRLAAEFIRDSALAVSGLLERRLGGPSVKPYQPPGYYRHLNFPKRRYQPDTGADQYRRGVYTHWQRIFLHPMLKAFDAPSREECTVQRPRSNTPLAALTLLNDPSFVEAAKAFAGRVVSQGGPSVEARIRWAWRQALSRGPSAAELDLLRALYETEHQRFERAPGCAAECLRTGFSPVPAGRDKTETAAWMSVCRSILNLNEFITRN